jgi:hypothetical protein
MVEEGEVDGQRWMDGLRMGNLGIGNWNWVRNWGRGREGGGCADADR